MTLQPVNPSSKKSRWKTIALILALLALGVWGILTSLCSAAERAHRVACGSNLRQIGQAIRLYAAENKSLPDSFSTLAATTDINPGVFLCPSTHISYADDYRLRKQCDHLSYIYLAAGQPVEILNNPNFILAYEPPTNHQGDGFNALFADGHVDWISKTEVKAFMSELNANQNPPGNGDEKPTAPRSIP